MSRPPIREKFIDAGYYGQVIDFKSPTLGYDYQPSIYAQAGFPGYPQPVSPGYPQPVSLQYPNQAMPAQLPMGAQYNPQYPAQGPFHQVGAPYTVPTPAPVAASLEDPADVKRRIDAKIEEILGNQRHEKADMLSAKVDKLTRHVQRLAEAMDDDDEDNDGGDSDEAETRARRSLKKIADKHSVKKSSHHW